MSTRLTTAFVAMLLILASCRSTKEIPAGAPPEMRLKEFMPAVQQAENEFENLLLKYNATYRSEGSNQSFRLEARIFADSAVWLDIADPILGFKVIRAVVYPDSVAFVNRLDKSFMTGNVGKLRDEFKLDFGFNDLQSILSANLLFALSRDFQLLYRPGLYLLSDFDPDGKDPSQFAGKEIFRQVSFGPQNLKPTLQVQNEPAMGRRYSVHYNDYSSQEGLQYPKQIVINFLEQSEGSLQLDLRSIEKNVSGLNLPFNIPPGYAPLR